MLLVKTANTDVVLPTFCSFALYKMLIISMGTKWQRDIGNLDFVSYSRQNMPCVVSYLGLASSGATLDRTPSSVCCVSSLHLSKQSTKPIVSLNLD